MLEGLSVVVLTPEGFSPFLLTKRKKMLEVTFILPVYLVRGNKKVNRMHTFI